VVFHFT